MPTGRPAMSVRTGRCATERRALPGALYSIRRPPHLTSRKSKGSLRPSCFGSRKPCAFSRGEDPSSGSIGSSGRRDLPHAPPPVDQGQTDRSKLSHLSQNPEPEIESQVGCGDRGFARALRQARSTPTSRRPSRRTSSQFGARDALRGRTAGDSSAALPRRHLPPAPGGGSSWITGY